MELGSNSVMRQVRRVFLCSVPQCHKKRTKNDQLFKIPLCVRNSRKQIKKWANALKVRNEFPKIYFVCSRHFFAEEILIPIKPVGKRCKVSLVRGAIPSRNLPKSSIRPKQELPGEPSDREKRLNARLRKAATTFLVENVDLQV